MKVLIFGATGGTGVHLVNQGLKMGYGITAFVRNPANLKIENKKLLVVKGDILNPKDVENAVKGQDVVISVLGNKTSQAFSKPITTVSDGLKNIISAMKKHKVERLLFVASFGVNENIFLPEKLILRTVLKNLFIDIPKQENLIKGSSLKWTIVHPARLVNTSKTERYNMGENLPIGLFSKISRADVADFLLKNIDNKNLINKIVTISY